MASRVGFRQCSSNGERLLGFTSAGDVAAREGILLHCSTKSTCLNTHVEDYGPSRPPASSTQTVRARNLPCFRQNHSPHPCPALYAVTFYPALSVEREFYSDLDDGQNPRRERFGSVTHLVGSFVQVLRIQRHAETQGGSRAEENVVRQGGDTTIVDLSLSSHSHVSLVYIHSPRRDIMP